MDVNELVAKNFKGIRVAKKLSLDSVSKFTGVSKSMLGQIERGEVNPTISVLWKIANGLKISFTSLIEKHEDEIQIVNKNQGISLQADEGKYINYLIFPFDLQHGFEVYTIEILSGGSLKADPHLQGTEEMITVFSGALELGVCDKIYTLSAGDSIRFKSDVNHSYKNPGNETTKLSMIIYYGQ
ncbi:MAG: helix-turn-helix domain-containing protein [Acetobacterium sp.]